jgi:small-conductance mechanosensitive channel
MPDWSVLSPLILVLVTVAATLAAGWLVDRALQRAAARHPDTAVWPLLRRCRIPLQLVVCFGLLVVNTPVQNLFDDHAEGVRHGLLLAAIASLGWLATRVLTAVISGSFSRYASSPAAADDPGRVKRVRTQLSLLGRVGGALIALVTVAWMLLTFHGARTIGASLLASAGLIGIVAGIAAQSTLGNFFSGLVIAFGDMVRIGDIVVVDGQQGAVEEITLSYLAVRLWDRRRLIVPVSYFVSKPFENWTRTDERTTGAVLLHLDHATPVAALRVELLRLLHASEEWDRTGWSLLVTDTTPSTVVVRASMTAATPDAAFALRCSVRENLLAYLRDHHPEALPRIRTDG